ncbi:MAG: hypothetical protein P8Y28_14240 [Gammaproteobacteria bacterium]
MESYTRIFIQLNPGHRDRLPGQTSAQEARSPRAALRLGLNGPSAMRWIRAARRG